ncbi:DUF924 domain-containing protein [Francisellaceae bacterium]|nr:DUF924 domain-containing protein [Francisellaceae bacterium]
MQDKIIDFWFKEAGPSNWWAKDVAFDNLIRERFLSVHNKAIAGELHSWRRTAHGRLAEIIVIDQFSRNIYRGDERSFIYDPVALVLAQEAIQAGSHQLLSIQERTFLYIPFMHSESKAIHEIAVKLFHTKGLEENLNFEYKHKEIIDKFGRYPHRNLILGRVSTSEELAFLKTPNSSF